MHVLPVSNKADPILNKTLSPTLNPFVFIT